MRQPPRQTSCEKAAALLMQRVPTYAEFLPQVVVADGKQSGQPLSVDGHPAQEAIIKALDSGEYQRLAWAKPVQDGGTLIGLVPVFRRAVVERQTVVLAYPTGDSAKDIWSTKVWPVLAAYGGQMPDTGGGSRGGAARVVTLPGGGRFILRAAGGRGESGQASITGDALFVDEVDDWPDLHRIILIGQRINESVDPLAIYCCTVKKDGEIGTPDGSLILALIQRGSDSHLEYPCPGCGAFQQIEWDRVDVDDHCYRCECGRGWTEQDRLAALRSWKLVHRNPVHRGFFTLRWSALDSPRKSLHQLIDEYNSAVAYASNGDHGPMRSFHRDRLTKPYVQIDEDETPQRPTRRWLESRSIASTYGPAISTKEDDGDSLTTSSVPEWCEYLVAACDVQRGGQRAPGRLYWTITGHAGDGKTALCHWGTVALSPIGRDPTIGELHDGLSRLDGLVSSLVVDNRQQIVRRVVDVGDQMDAIVQWVRRNLRWWPIRGDGGRLKHELMATINGTRLVKNPSHTDLPGCLYPRVQAAGWWLYHIDTDSVRSRLHAAAMVAPGSAGAFHLPSGLDTTKAIIRHFCATAEIPDGRGGTRWSDRATDRAHHAEWQRRCDYLDCLVYGEAAALHYRRTTSGTRRQETPTRSAPRRPLGVVGRND